ncbi:N-hydroxythioamide S-beta-glucosyltransferase [Ranunculus cassubicifolius]
MESKKPHVLFITYPLLGHINPMLHFAKRLASKGIKVTLSPPISMINSIKSDDSDIIIVPYSDGWDTGYMQALTPKNYMLGFQQNGLKNISNLIETLQQSTYPVTCLAYSSYLPLVLGIAKQFDLVGAAFFISPCSVNVIHYHVHQGHLTAPVEEQLVISLPGMPSLETRDLPTSITKDSHIFLELCLNQYSNMDEADWLLFNSFDILEDQVVEWLKKKWPRKVLTTGSYVPSSNPIPSLSPPILWLDGKEDRSVVYVAFGSLVELQEEQYVELAWALKESNKHFLWILGDADNEKLPKELKEQLSEKGFIVPWCLQLEVLAHKSIGCFITHCGWNSTLEALSFGVPMVAMPHFLDHTTIAKYVQDVWRVGVRVNKDESGIISRKDLGDCIEVVMHGDIGKDINRNADTWKELMKEAVSVGGNSDMNADVFIASFTTSNK